MTTKTRASSVGGLEDAEWEGGWEAFEYTQGPEILAHYRDECCAKRDFAEAKAANIRIDKIRLQAAFNNCERVSAEQVKEFKALMSKHRFEIGKFQRKWQTKFEDFQSRVSKVKEGFSEHQKEELTEHCEKVSRDVETHISCRTRDMKMQVDRFANVRRYDEAATQLAEAEANEERERRFRILEHRNKVRLEGGAKQHFLDKQANDKDNFMARIKIEGLKLTGQKNREMEVMLRHHKIERNKLESKHMKAQLQAKKALAAPGTALARSTSTPEFDFAIRSRKEARWT